MTLAGLVRSRDRLMGIGQAINALYPVEVMPRWLAAHSGQWTSLCCYLHRYSESPRRQRFYDDWWRRSLGRHAPCRILFGRGLFQRRVVIVICG